MEDLSQCRDDKGEDRLQFGQTQAFIEEGTSCS